MKGLYVMRSKRVLRKMGSSAAEGLSFHNGLLSFSAISVQVGKFCEWDPVQAGIVPCLCSLLLLQPCCVGWHPGLKPAVSEWS